MQEFSRLCCSEPTAPMNTLFKSGVSHQETYPLRIVVELRHYPKLNYDFVAYFVTLEYLAGGFGTLNLFVDFAFRLTSAQTRFTVHQ